MDRVRNAATGALIAAAVLAPAALAAGATSHAPVFETKTVGCGIADASGPSGQVLCSATKGIPKPKGQNDGDPYVSLGRTGKPTLVLISQDSFGTDKFAQLKPGARWSSHGVTCTIGNPAVTCTNSSKHGFTIGNGKYKAF